MYKYIWPPSWHYGLAKHSVAARKHFYKVRVFQNKYPRDITGAEWFKGNEDIHKDLDTFLIGDVLNQIARALKRRLALHVNHPAITAKLFISRQCLNRYTFGLLKILLLP